MKTWYKAVCDEHKEMIDIFVSNIKCTATYLEDHDELINSWLQLHYGCKLRLVHLDTDLDELFDAGYECVKK